VPTVTGGPSGGDDADVHLELARALAPVLQDLTSTGAPVPRVVDEDWQDGPSRTGATLFAADGSGMGIWVELGAPRAEQ